MVSKHMETLPVGANIYGQPGVVAVLEQYCKPTHSKIGPRGLAKLLDEARYHRDESHNGYGFLLDLNKRYPWFALYFREHGHARHAKNAHVPTYDSFCAAMDVLGKPDLRVPPEMLPVMSKPDDLSNIGNGKGHNSRVWLQRMALGYSGVR